MYCLNLLEYHLILITVKRNVVNQESVYIFSNGDLWFDLT